MHGGYALTQIAQDDLGGKMLFAGSHFLLAELVLLEGAWAQLGSRRADAIQVGALFARHRTGSAVNEVSVQPMTGSTVGDLGSASA